MVQFSIKTISEENEAKGKYLWKIVSTNFIRSSIDENGHTGNIKANIRLSKHLNFYASCHIEDGFSGDRGDDRDDASGYGIVNATLIAKKFIKGFEVRGSVYNLFDKDYVSPPIVIVA